MNLSDDIIECIILKLDTISYILCMRTVCKRFYIVCKRARIRLHISNIASDTPLKELYKGFDDANTKTFISRRTYFTHRLLNSCTLKDRVLKYRAWLDFDHDSFRLSSYETGMILDNDIINDRQYKIIVKDGKCTYEVPSKWKIPMPYILNRKLTIDIFERTTGKRVMPIPAILVCVNTNVLNTFYDDDREVTYSFLPDNSRGYILHKRT